MFLLLKCDNPSHLLITTRHVGVLVKGEVLGLNNAKRTNNIIMESEKTHNGGVRVGVLQKCEPGVPVSGTGCHIKSRQFLTIRPAHSEPGSKPCRAPTPSPSL